MTEVSEGIAEAQGPATVQFTPGDIPGQHTTVLQMAGTYVVHVRLEACAVAGWPRVLHVVATRAHAARSAYRLDFIDPFCCNRAIIRLQHLATARHYELHQRVWQSGSVECVLPFCN